MITSHKLDAITVSPDITGEVGVAWLVDLEAATRTYGDGREHGTLAVWIVEAPWAHPIWHSYAITLMHLRPMADGRETLRYLDGGTHEIWVQALNPDHPREPAIRAAEPWHFLTPSNFAAQFIEPSDEAAMARVRKSVGMICDGQLSPDTDFIQQWMALYGDNMIKGDKARAGETRIVTPESEIVIPPQPATGEKA